MALVAYGSDSDSDTEDKTVIESKATQPAASKALSSGLSSPLPPQLSSNGGNHTSLTHNYQTTATSELPANPPLPSSSSSSRARKSKILTMPTLEPESDESDDESNPFVKRQKLGSGSSTAGGLFDRLPAPKNHKTGVFSSNASGKESAATTTIASKATTVPVTSKLTSLAPRTLKPAVAKASSATKTGKKAIVTEDTDDDEDAGDEPASFFPLGTAVTAVKPVPQLASTAMSYFDKNRGGSTNDSSTSRIQQKQEGREEGSEGAQKAEEVEAYYSNEMYAYSSNDQYAYPTNDQYAYEQYAYAGYEGYYDSQAYADPSTSTSAPSNTISLDEKSMQRLGGRTKGISGSIQVVDVNASRQMQDAPHLQRTMGKSMPKQVDSGTINHLKPSNMQKRKHNIMSLAYQAKANEHTLAAQWSSSRQTKAETHAKYGF